MTDSSTPTVEDNIDVDLGYLTAYNNEPLKSLNDDYLLERAENDVQVLFQKLHELARSQVHPPLLPHRFTCPSSQR